LCTTAPLSRRKPVQQMITIPSLMTVGEGAIMVARPWCLPLSLTFWDAGHGPRRAGATPKGDDRYGSAVRVGAIPCGRPLASLHIIVEQYSRVYLFPCIMQCICKVMLGERASIQHAAPCRHRRRAIQSNFRPFANAHKGLRPYSPMAARKVRS